MSCDCPSFRYETDDDGVYFKTHLHKAWCETYSSLRNSNDLFKSLGKISKMLWYHGYGNGIMVWKFKLSSVTALHNSK